MNHSNLTYKFTLSSPNVFVIDLKCVLIEFKDIESISASSIIIMRLLLSRASIHGAILIRNVLIQPLLSRKTPLNPGNTYSSHAHFYTIRNDMYIINAIRSKPKC